MGRFSTFIRVGVFGLLVALGTAHAQPSPPAPLQPAPAPTQPSPVAPAPSTPPGSTPEPEPSAAAEPVPAPPLPPPSEPTPSGPAPAAAPLEPSSGAVLADPYGISQAKPIPQPVPGAPGGNPYRGPDASPPPRRELPVLSQPCVPGMKCLDDPRLYDRFRAVRGSPFVQALSGAFHFRERVSSALAFGGELGVFLFDRLRASARALVPIAEVDDEINADAASSEPSAWLWGISVGAATDHQPGFVLSPSLQYLMIVGDDYGHTLGILMPLEWLSESGFRVGFDFSLLYGFGGTYMPAAQRVFPPVQGVSAEDRPNSAGFSANFSVGYAFGLKSD